MASSRNTMPSLAALLGLLAVAGYQNRDKLGQLFQGAKTDAQNSGGILGEIGNMFGGAEGGSLSKGLGELVDTFKNGGHHEAADSWVSPNAPSQGISPEQVESVIGTDTLQELAAKTGLDYNDLLKRLSSSIPETVDKMTPNGQLPQNDDQIHQLLGGSTGPASA
ncbi:YidB family protein [Chelativorans alearense]|uniref:YidB family protein n=1 Tax=Chelativorans alearense TaxID=2681495 RepID=UPI0013D8278C|nr:YidB family protein [Chelativorans alearense]